MNYRHVVRLKYKLVTGDSVSYNSPPRVFSDPGFDLKLENGVLTVEMKEHHATVGSAIVRIRPHFAHGKFRQVCSTGGMR